MFAYLSSTACIDQTGRSESHLELLAQVRWAQRHSLGSFCAADGRCPGRACSAVAVPRRVAGPSPGRCSEHCSAAGVRFGLHNRVSEHTSSAARIARDPHGTRNLHWIPNTTFDFVFSFAAIYHLEITDQCDVGWQLLAKLKARGRSRGLRL